MKARDIPMETFEPIDIIADEPEQKPFDNEGFDRDVKRLASSDDRVAALVGLLGKYEQGGAGQFLLERGDDGKLKHGAELRVIADVLSGKGSEDSVGSYFYGDDWSRVKAEAESFRREMNAGLHVGTGVWNTSPGMFTASDGAVKEAMRYDLGPHRLTLANTLTHKPPSRAEDPTRSYFVPATGSTFTPRDRLAEIIHEVTGHGFNNVRLTGDEQPEDPLKQDNTRNMYYVANDAELMAELGNLRKFVYRSSRLSGKTVDIASGDNLTLVLDSLKKNKDAYGPLPYTTEQFVEQMNKLRTYDEGDRFLRSRRDEVFRKLTGDGSGRYLKQVVRYSPNNKTREQERHADSKGGNASGPSKSSGVPSGHNPALDGYIGPRVVINPSTFRNEKDSLCVAFNEAFRILMAVNGFDPVAEPTEKQREFFSDTAYADDELQMRRTILARLCTFDTSVTDPTDEQLQEAVEFLDTVLEIGAPQNQWEQRAVERIRTAISRALESGERVPASQAPAPEDSPEVAAGGAGSSASGVPKDEEKDSGAEFRENARAQMDEAAKLAQEGPTAEEQKTQAMAEAAGESAGDDPFGKSAEMKAAAQEAGIKADIAEAQKPENLIQKNGHYVDAQGRVISERAAKALAEQGVRNSAAQDTNNQQQQAPGADMDAAQNSPRTGSERIGVSSGIKGPDGRELTAGEAAWMARRQASTAAWMQRTGRSGDGVADALAQRDERANNLRQVGNGRRDALGRRLDDRGRVIA